MQEHVNVCTSQFRMSNEYIIDIVIKKDINETIP